MATATPSTTVHATGILSGILQKTRAAVARRVRHLAWVVLDLHTEFEPLD